MTRVSCFVHDLSANPIVRAAPLAHALAGVCEVEVLGLQFGDDIYAPYRDLFPYQTVRTTPDLPSVARAAHRLAALATGQVIYAFKPLATSLGPALLASGFGRRRPLLLDVEDDEWVPMGETWPAFIRRDLVGGWRHATAWKYTRALHPLTACASGVSVSGRALQARYGGTVVRHGPDDALFDPARTPGSAAARARFGLPAGVPLALFAGMPQPHKGFDVLRRALLTPAAAAWHLVLAGDPAHDEFVACASALGDRCHRIGLVPQADMPVLLAAVDAVPVPQRRVRFAESQLPAKAIEGMAMARAVIASRVADLPEILGDGARGWLVPPDDPAALADALRLVATDAAEVQRRGAAARQWFLAEASRQAIRKHVVPLVERALGTRR